MEQKEMGREKDTERDGQREKEYETERDGERENIKEIVQAKRRRKWAEFPEQCARAP